MSYKKFLFVGLMVLGIAIALAACGSTPTTEATPCPDCPTAEPCPTAAPCPECETCPEPVVADVPFEKAWVGSGHANKDAEAFRHWDEEDPQEVPADCAKCHSATGYMDFLGADESAFGVVDVNQPVSNGITCVACHNQASLAMTSVTFPSGAAINDLGAEARCMQCHQGRASMVQVDEGIAALALADDDTVSADLGFINIHYFAAAATLYGTYTKGGYEYAGQAYDAKNDHVAGYDTCIGCHNSHSLEIKVEQCAVCHTNVASVDDLKNIRMAGSLVDYDGDGDISEGVASEITGLQEMLLTAIQAYASEVGGAAIVYDQAAYPYFFIDTNANGTGDPDEVAFANKYASWTGRLLKAGYNYQTSVKDPGAFAHGGKYIIELLYDSIADLNTKISTPVDLSMANRIDAGHFAGSQEAFRHWDEDEPAMISGGCAKCHSAEGLPTFLANATNIAVHPSNGLNCATCHNDLSAFTRFTVDVVTFPSGAKLSFGEMVDANLCINCHQGRESTVSVDKAIATAGVEDDVVTDKLSVKNPHYFAAGATLFGGDAKGAYQFADKEYLGRNMHVEGVQTCSDCHDAHALNVQAEKCSVCHTTVKTEEDLMTIRMSTTDFDGDGDVTEGMYGEVMTEAEMLLAAIQTYAMETAGAPIAFSNTAYPYFLIDTNANGVIDPDEAVRTNAYVNWTPNLLRASYNYLWVAKDPGAFAHNGKYILQVLYDSIEALGGDVTTLTRP